MSELNKKFKILDCTLRDGGYYTNWDFDKTLVQEYCQAMEESPITYVEVGYRSIPLEGYLGEYFYCPEYVMEELKSLMPSKKLVIILDEKNIRVKDVKSLLEPCLPFISMIRLAVDPKNIKRACDLAKEIKLLHFEVAFNVMYMSNWKNSPEFLDELDGIDSFVDYFYMVDSFGAVFPKDINEILDIIKPKLSIPIGFHGHNNLEMALVNSMTAIEGGCELIDCTITGMGRGAGNLRTELFLTYLNSIGEYDIEYIELSKTVASFEKMKSHYKWGASLPYMFSGAFSLPQKQVMEWVGMNRYPLSSIVNALSNQKDHVQDNLRLPIFSKNKRYKTAVILGGGKSIVNIDFALKKFLDKSDDTCLIHAGVRHVKDYINLESDQFYALVGFESEKLLKQLGELTLNTQSCVYPPYPRKMGTIVPEKIKDYSYELKSLSHISSSDDSPMAIAIQAAIDLGVKNIFLAGFDGYDMSLIDETQYILAQENQSIINDIAKIDSLRISAITPTKYRNIKTISIYSLL